MMGTIEERFGVESVVLDTFLLSVLYSKVIK